eukprot:114636-Amphidinium_carterae.1
MQRITQSDGVCIGALLLTVSAVQKGGVRACGGGLMRNCSSLKDPMLAVSGNAWADAKEVFPPQISDHLPQDSEFQVQHNSHQLFILTWNMMSRAMCRADDWGGDVTSVTASTNTSLVDKRTNNGFDLDENILDYESRVTTRIAPMIAEWVLS